VADICSLGVHINANSISEFQKIKSVLSELQGNESVSKVSIGLRVNPLVGEGAIAALSTATSTSKFGVPLTSEGRALILDLFRDHSCLTSLMCHVGSQGIFDE
jgi:diaminopimelate decarboxylase